MNGFVSSEGHRSELGDATYVLPLQTQRLQSFVQAVGDHSCSFDTALVALQITAVRSDRPGPWIWTYLAASWPRLGSEPFEVSLLAYPS